MIAFEVIGWVAFALNVWGNLALTKQSNRGHVIRLCSNACWIVYAPFTGAWALLINHLTFACINVLGFYRWRKIERAKLESDYAVQLAWEHKHGRPR